MQLKEKSTKWLKKASNFLKSDLIYILKGGSYLTLGNFSVILVNFLLAFFFARLLPKEAFGNYNYILAWISVLGIFALPGMDTAVLQSVSRGFEGSLVQGLNKKIQYGFWGTLGALLLSAYYSYHQNQILGTAFFISAAFIPFLTSFQIYNSYLIGKKEFKTSTYFLVAGQIFTALALIGTVFWTQNIIILVGVYLLAHLIPNLIFWGVIKKRIGPIPKEDPQTLSYAKHLSLINILNTVVSYLDQFLAFHFLGAASLAAYALAIGPPEQIKGLFKGIPDLALPKFSQRREAELKKTMKQKILVISVFTVLIVGIYIFLAPWFYKIFFPRYPEAIFLSQIFSLSLLNAAPVLIISALTAHRRIKKLYLFNIVSPVFQIIIMTILTPLYGLTGLIVSRIISRTFTSFLSLYIYWRA